MQAPKLHHYLNDPTIKRLTYGGKGVGSQGDGTVQFLAKDKEAQQKLIEYLKNKAHMEPFPFTLPAGGKVKNAIIPIAGNGTRMFPETMFIKKAFLPVIDQNGVTKPILLLMLEELVAADIENIFLIIGNGEEEE